MTTNTTFEDRLLAELQGEIERREADPVPGARRRLVTGRRLALAAAACAVAALAVVLVPGSPADSPAYAVERHRDGSFTLTIGPEAGQRHPARTRRAVPCRRDPRGHPEPRQRAPVRAAPRKSIPPHDPGGSSWKITLHRGDSVAFENGQDTGGKVWALSFCAIKGKLEPSVLTERDSPLAEVTASPSATMR